MGTGEGWQACRSIERGGSKRDSCWYFRVGVDRREKTEERRESEIERGSRERGRERKKSINLKIQERTIDRLLDRYRER